MVNGNFSNDSAISFAQNWFLYTGTYIILRAYILVGIAEVNFPVLFVYKKVTKILIFCLNRKLVEMLTVNDNS